jgi:MFS family permease
MTVQTERPTSVRYVIVAVVTLMSFLLYLDRFCVSFAADYIRQDLRLSQTQISYFISAFFWSYALAQVPAGWFSDRFGARTILAAYILSWSLFTAWIGAAHSFFILMLARVGCGLGQAGAYPAAASVVRRWMPLSTRGTASSFVANGGRIGAALAPVLTAYLMVMFVPMNTPVTLHVEDILEPEKIVEWFANPETAVLLRRPLPAADAGMMAKLKDHASFSQQDRYEISRALSRLVERGSLYNPKKMSNLNLPREAFLTIDKLASHEAVREEEKDRLNRLILEALLPTSIKRLYGLGWRSILYVYGGAGIVVALVYWMLFRETPSVHPGTNQAERDLISGGQEQSPAATARKLDVVPIGKFLTSLNMWCNSLMQFGTNIGWLFIVTLLPRFFFDVYDVPIIARGYMTMIPALVGIVGLYLGGQLTDRWAQRFGIKWGRRLPILVSRLTAIGAYAGCIGVTLLPSDSPLNSPWSITALCAIAAFSTDLGIAPTWAFVQDVGGRHTASVLGWGNMWGNLGAAIAPLVYNSALGEKPTVADWNVTFGICALAFLFSGACALAIDATQPVFADVEE